MSHPSVKASARDRGIPTCHGVEQLLELWIVRRAAPVHETHVLKLPKAPWNLDVIYQDGHEDPALLAVIRFVQHPVNLGPEGDRGWSSSGRSACQASEPRLLTLGSARPRGRPRELRGAAWVHCHGVAE